MPNFLSFLTCCFKKPDKSLKGKDALNKWKTVNKQVIATTTWKSQFSRALRRKNALGKWGTAKNKTTGMAMWKISMPEKLKKRGNMARWKRANETIISTRKWKFALPNFLRSKAARGKWRRAQNKVKMAEAMGIDVGTIIKEKHKKSVFFRWKEMFLKLKMRLKRDPAKRKKAKKQWLKATTLTKFLVKPQIKPMSPRTLAKIHKDRVEFEKVKEKSLSRTMSRESLSDALILAAKLATEESGSVENRDDISNSVGTAIQVANAIGKIKQRVRTHRLQAIFEDETLEEEKKVSNKMASRRGSVISLARDVVGIGSASRVMSRTTSRRGSILNLQGSTPSPVPSKDINVNPERSQSRSMSRTPSRLGMTSGLGMEDTSRSSSRFPVSPTPTTDIDVDSSDFDTTLENVQKQQQGRRPIQRSDSNMDEIVRMKSRMSSRMGSRKPSVQEIESVKNVLGRLHQNGGADDADEDSKALKDALSRLQLRKQSQAGAPGGDDQDDHVSRALSRLSSRKKSEAFGGQKVQNPDDLASEMAKVFSRMSSGKGGKDDDMSPEEMQALTEALAEEMARKNEFAEKRVVKSREEVEKELKSLKTEVRMVIKMIREADEIKKRSRRDWDKILPLYKTAWEKTEVPLCVLDLIKSVRFNPPKIVLLIFEGICVLKGIQPEVYRGGLRREILSVDYKKASQRLLAANFPEELYDLRNSDQISLVNIVEFQERIMQNPDFQRWDKVIRAFPPCAVLFDWLIRIERFAKISLEIEEIKRMKQLANSLKKQGKITLKQLKLNISEIEQNS